MAKRGKRQTGKGSTNKTKSPAKSARTPEPTASTAAGEMSGAQRIVWVCLHLLVLLVPIAMSNWTWAGFQLPITYDQFDIIKVFLQRGLTLIAFGAWSWHILTKGGRIRRTKIDYLILVLLGWILLTSFTSIHPPTAFFGKYRRFEGFISFVNYAIIFFLTVQMVDRASRIRSLARTLFFGGVLVSAYGMMQYVGIDPIDWGALPFEVNRAFSTYGNPDLLGGYIVFPLVISLGLALSETDVWWRAAYWFGFLLNVSVWIVAFTRGAWIGGAFAIILLVIVAVMQRTKLTAVDYGFMGVIATVATTLVVVSLSATSSVMNVAKRLASIFDFDAGSTQTRFQIWEAALDSTKDRPLFGFGADTFRLVFPKYKPVEYVADAGYLSVADNVHNYPLQVSSALGIPGFLLLYGTFGAAAWFSAPLVFKRHEGTDRLVLASFWAAAAGYLAHLMFGISVTGSSFLLWIAMAVVLTPLATSIEVRSPKWATPVGIVSLLLVAVLSIGNVVYIVADNYYLQARVASQGQVRIEHVLDAIKLNPYNDMYRSELGMAYIDSMLLFMQQAQSDPTNAQAYSDSGYAEFLKAEDALKAAIEFSPWEYDNYVFLANLYNAAAEFFDVAYYDEAIVIARRGVEVEEFGPAIRFQLARALVAKGEFEEAREHIAYAVEMDPKYADAHILLAEIYLELDQLEEALDMYQKALALNPGYSGLEQAIQSLEASLGVSEE